MLLISCVLLVTHTVCGQTVTFLVGDAAVIPCRISETFTYPQWRGPPTFSIYTLQNRPTINPNVANSDRLTYNTDQRSIKIANTATTDAGEFRCFKTINGSLFIANVTLEVRVSPSAPTFSTNIGQISNNRLIVTEDKQVTLTCTSREGNPVSTVKLYQTSVSGSPVVQTSTGTQEADGTWTVNLNYQFTAVRSLDRLNYICTSAFNTAPFSQQTATIQFYFNLKPSTPSISLVGTPISGQSSQTIARCTTSGFRLAAGISMTMTFRGATITYNTVVGPSSTDTYSVTGDYSKAVDKTDNGHTLTLSVSHSTLQSSLSSSIPISVQFAPDSATLSLQPNAVADGTRHILATCTSGSSNPASTITWIVDGAPVTSSKPSTTGNGANNGRATTQQLQLVASRDMQGKSIVCFVSNTVNTQTPVASIQKTLNLKFRPISIVTGPTSPVMEGQFSGPLTCKVTSNPVSTSITWYYGNTAISSRSNTVTGNVATYTIPNVNRTDAGRYKCTAVNGYNLAGEDTTYLSGLFAPRAVSVSGNKHLVVDGINTVRVTCTTGEANLQSDITWRRNSRHITSSSNIVYQDGQYSGKTSTQVLDFIPTRDDQSVTCRASNTLNTNSPVSDIIILDTKYPPLITTTPSSPVTKAEGSGNLLLICNVSSRPLSTITWAKNGQWLKTGSVNTANNSLDYTISNIDREKAGEYRCKAKNNIGGAVRKNIQVIVQYAPDVTVATTNTTASASSVDVVCRPSGVPTTYAITQWTQTWTDGTVINSNLPLQQTLTLTDLSFQHSGLYTCMASNGIKASNNPNAGVGSAYLLIKSRPILTKPVIEENNSYKAAATLGVPISVVITYYSNVANDKVDLYAGVGDTKRKIDVGLINIVDMTVQLSVFQQTVEVTGRQASITFTITQKEDFQNYSIDVYNDIGHHILVLEINPKGPPENPDKLALGDPTETSIPVFWIRGFHGGADQTFVIQVSSNEQDWKNVSSLNDYREVGNDVLNATITDLSSGTLYYIRLFSFNRFGHSHGFTKHLSFTTKEDTQHTITESSTSTAGIIGGVTGAVIVIALVVIAICMARKYNIKLICEKKQGEEPQNELREYENVTTQGERQPDASERVSNYNTGRESEPDLSTYESLSDREPTPNMYSALQPIEMAPTRNTASNPDVSEPIQLQYESLTDREADPNMYSSLADTESSQDGKDALNPEQVYDNVKV